MTKAINIAVIGSHKIGKTTLYNEVVEALLSKWNIVCLDEIALEGIAEANTFFKYMSLQEKILTHQIKVLEWAKENEVSTFSDRSLIDNLAYFNIGRESPYPYALSNDFKSSLEIIKVLSPVVSEAIAHLYDYDLLFYIPIEFKLGSPTKEQISYQESVDKVIKYILEVYGIRYHTVTGSIEERTRFVVEIIKQNMGGE